MKKAEMWIGLAVSIAGLLVGGFFVWWVWNSLMPDLFGLPIITYTQAVALKVLAGSLVKETKWADDR